MAKSARASVRKSNRSKLRARVFAPVEDARTQRLHAKLLELVNQPKPEPPKKSDMEIDSTEEPTATAQAQTKEDEYPKDMEVDDGAAPAAEESKPKKSKRTERPRKRPRKKPKNQIQFPKSRGKGALKPFSESRIRKRRST